MRRKMKVKTLYREIKVDREHIDEESRTAELSFSSEEPYDRYFGVEILDHGPGSVRLGRLDGAGNLLVDHDTRDVVGVVEKAEVKDRRGRAVVRFGKSERASEIFNDVNDGIRQSVSVGYRVHEMVLEKQSDEGPDTYRVSDWEPLEISLVSVPADATVGVGRSNDEEHECVVIEPDKEEKKMEKKDETPAKQEPEKIDIKSVRDEARKAEQNRIRDITSIGEKMKQTELARQFVENGQSVDAFREALLDKMGDAAPLKPMPEDASEIGMTDKEKRSYSFIRAINALANPTDRRAQEAAKFEFECSDAAATRTGKEPQGILVPFDVLARDLSVGTATAGGNTVSTDLLAESFIATLENAMALTELGITRLTGLQGNIAIPRQTGGATAYWVAEAASPTESQQAFDQVSMTPNTVGAFTDFSRKLMLQSSLDIENFVRNDLALRLALEIDRAGVNGSGSGAEPTGILNTSGIGDVAGGTNGLAPTWAHIVELESDVANANAAMGSLGYLTNTKVRGKLKTTEKFSGTNGNPVYGEGDTPLNGYRTVISNQVPSNLTKGTGTNLSAIIFGNFADLVVGMWGGLDLLVDPYTASSSGTIRVVALQDVDIALRHAESFSAMQDAITV